MVKREVKWKRKMEGEKWNNREERGWETEKGERERLKGGVN